eukprot:15455820-Alexandrium_andersonii.AAC.1
MFEDANKPRSSKPLQAVDHAAGCAIPSPRLPPLATQVAHVGNMATSSTAIATSRIAKKAARHMSVTHECYPGSVL